MRVPLDTKEYDLDKFRDLLTLKNPAYVSAVKYAYSSYAASKIPEHLSFYSEDKGYAVLPRNILRLAGYAEPVIREEAHSEGRPLSVKSSPVVPLWDFQEAYLFGVLKRQQHDVVLQVPCGHGKTNMALHLTAKYNVRTLVLVPTNKLAYQWVSRTQELLPNLSVNRFTSSDDPEDIDVSADVTIMTIELFSIREFPEHFFDAVGHVILDEAHRVGAPTYHPIISRLTAKYRTALSATFRRKDGMAPLLQMHFGNSHVMTNKFPLAKFVGMRTGIMLDSDSRRKVMQRGKLSFTKLDTWVAENHTRNKILFSSIMNMIRRGRVPLVISKRRGVLEKMYEMALNRGLNACLVVGGSDDITKEQADTCDVFFGISQLAEEGLDLPRIDTLIPIHPIPDIEQAAGRIRRIHPGKKDPLVLWPMDEIDVYIRMTNKACQFTDVLTVKNTLHYTDVLKVEK